MFLSKQLPINTPIIRPTSMRIPACRYFFYNRLIEMILLSRLYLRHRVMRILPLTNLRIYNVIYFELSPKSENQLSVS